MPTLIEMSPSPNELLIPGQVITPATTTTTTTTAELSYKEVIRQLAAQTQMKPYGDIPPMLNKKRNNKKTRRQKLNNNQRRMSHVEDWIKVDSKESLPDEEDLVKFIYIVSI
jgi:CelD/BcsL family acetyltransferase involved in cellulose biosynthesis